MPPRKVDPARRATPASGRDGASNTPDVRRAFSGLLDRLLGHSADATTRERFLSRVEAGIRGAKSVLETMGAPGASLVAKRRRAAQKCLRASALMQVAQQSLGITAVHLRRHLDVFAAKVEIIAKPNKAGSPKRAYGWELYLQAYATLLSVRIDPKPGSRHGKKPTSSPGQQVAELMHSVITQDPRFRKVPMPDQRSGPSRRELEALGRAEHEQTMQLGDQHEADLLAALLLKLQEQ